MSGCTITLTKFGRDAPCFRPRLSLARVTEIEDWLEEELDFFEGVQGYRA